MCDAASRKRAAIRRIEEVVRAPVRLPERGPVILPSGRPIYLVYAKGHQRGSGTTFWFGIPRDACQEDLLVLLLGDADFVASVADLTEQAAHMTRSADGRLTPYVVEIDGQYEQRVPNAGAVTSLQPYRDAFSRCR